MKKKPRHTLSATQTYLRCYTIKYFKKRVKLEVVGLKKCRKYIIKNLYLGSLKCSSELPGG